MVTAIFPEGPNVPLHEGTGSSSPEVFPGRREIPQLLREGIQESCTVCWEHPCPAALSALSLLPCTVVSRCPQMQLSNHLSVGSGLPTVLQLLTAQLQSHSPCLTPGTAGTQNWVLHAPWGRAGFGDRAGKHPPDRQSGCGWVLGIR